MDALHFRTRAAKARMMAENGDDVRISRMLLDVADELDAEADLMEAEAATQAPLGETKPPLDPSSVNCTRSSFSPQAA